LHGTLLPLLAATLLLLLTAALLLAALSHRVSSFSPTGLGTRRRGNSRFSSYPAPAETRPLEPVSRLAAAFSGQDGGARKMK
jgi:hypothetical protein